MGKEKVIEKIRKDGSKIITGGIVLTSFGILLSLFFLLIFEGLNGFHVISSFPLIAGVIMIIVGSKRKKDPMTAKCFKINPQLLQQADELFGNIVFEDKMIIFSEKVIASKKDITQMVYFSDIVWMYEHQTSYNFVPTDHQLVIRTLKYSISINIYGKKKQTRVELLERIYRMCSFARVGYTNEHQEYFNYLVKDSKKSM